MTPPPRTAVWLLEQLLPRRHAEPILGDLQETWRGAAAPSAWRFWVLALRAIGTCWAGRLRTALVREGAPASTTEGDGVMRSLLQDVRDGWRQMRRNPGFTAAAVVTLALGIGVNAAIFAIVNVLALKPLPYAAADRVAFVLGWDVEHDDMRFNVRAADYLDLRRRLTTLEVAAYTALSANLSGGDVPERVQAYRVTATAFPLLGVEPALGRTIDESDVRAGRGVAVLSHGLWQRAFGGDPGVTGRHIVLNGAAYDVIGVMPPAFEFPVFNFKGDVWIPWRIDGAGRGEPAGGQSATVVGRLREGISYDEAQAEVDAVMALLAREHPATNRGLGARVVEMGRLDDEQAGPVVPLVLATAALVLALACANVASLLMARGLSRHRELAVRGALGASRGRIVRQLFVEALLLALAGGALGVLAATATLPLVRAALPEFLVSTVPNLDALRVDRITLAYGIAATLAASLVFGVLPALRSAGRRLRDGLGESGTAAGSRSTYRLRAGLVAGEIALAALLLIVAGLFVRSLTEMRRVDPGFDASGVLTMALTLPEHRYPDAAARRRFFEDALARLQSLGAVRSAGAVNVLPFSTSDRAARLWIEGEPSLDAGREPLVAYRVASPAYHATLRIPLLDGRYFGPRDAPPAAPVAIVNATLARRHFAGRSPLGRRVRLGPAEPWLTIVGVVGDVRHSTLTEAADPEIHVPLAHAPGATMMLAIRTDAEPRELAAAVRTEIARLDEAQPLYHVKTLDTLVGDSLLSQRFSTVALALFGGLALALAAVGIYGVVAQAVQQRTRELGVRMALGATRRDVLVLVVRTGLAMVGAGLALGVAGAAALSGMLRTIVYGVTPSDPLVYAAAALALATVGLGACAVPAWRASRADPMLALRSD